MDKDKIIEAINKAVAYRKQIDETIMKQQQEQRAVTDALKSHVWVDKEEEEKYKKLHNNNSIDCTNKGKGLYKFANNSDEVRKVDLITFLLNS